MTSRAEAVGPPLVDGDQQNVVVAFHGNDNGGWASGWAVDDILITFSSAQVSRNLHFELTELGEWFVTADKKY